MNTQQAATAVAYLTSLTSGWNDDSTEQLVYEFERLEDPEALRDAVGKVARSWTGFGRVPLGILMDAYHHEIALRNTAAKAALANRSVRCDSSGWIDGWP